MKTCPTFTHLLVLPHLHVQNANAISSPLTHGFPSMTAFLGLMWALERKTRKRGLPLAFKAVGVICHDHHEQTSDGGFIKTFRLTRNPIGKDGSTAAIVEEGRTHLDVSFAFALRAPEWSLEAQVRDLATVAELIAGMRIAGGTLNPPGDPRSRRHAPWITDFTGTADDQTQAFRKLRARLLPGWALVARDDLLNARLAALQRDQPDTSRLDAWLSLARTDWHYQSGADGGAGKWISNRPKGSGWIVPIPVGYGALGALHPAGSVANARDATTPFRFVESLYSVGEWIGPHHLANPQELLWYADSNPETGRYRCGNDYAAAPNAVEPENLFDFDLT